MLVLLTIAHGQGFEDFEGFDASQFGHFGGQDLSGFESGGFDGSFADASDFNFEQFGGGDVDHFSAFQKK